MKFGPAGQTPTMVFSLLIMVTRSLAEACEEGEEEIFRNLSET
jgi:hypothetical protein